MRLTLKDKNDKAHEDAVWCATWTPSQGLITGSVDESVRVWQPADISESLHTYTGIFQHSN